MPGIKPIGHPASSLSMSIFIITFINIRKKLIPLALKSQWDFLYISVRSDFHLLRLPNSKSFLLVNFSS